MARRPLKKRILNSRAMHGLGSFLASLVMRAIYYSSRVQQTMSPEVLAHARGEHPAIFCFWHGRMLMHPFLKPPGRGMHVLISHHNDGALITATMRWFGVDAVRGSPKRGSTKALRDLLDITQRGDNICITPDGPRGPFQKAAAGAAYVASKTGYPLVPVTWSAHRHWRLKSWDRFMIPKLFSRIVFVMGEPIFVTADGADDVIATSTQVLEASLIRITQRADEICGVAA